MTRDHSHVRLFIFDADGTLRWTTLPGRKYPLSSGEWRLMPGVEARLRAIPWSPCGPWLAIASNQNGVAAGELSEDRARELHGHAESGAWQHSGGNAGLALHLRRAPALRLPQARAGPVAALARSFRRFAR